MSRWFLMLGVLACCALSSLAGIAKPTLTGQVADTNGVPVEGATVFVYSAGPRVGTSMFCPTCYPDCKKNAVTDASGNFKIPELNPDLIFRLLVVKKNFRPLFVPKTDPVKSPVVIKVEPRSEERIPSRFLSGRILDPEGQPVRHAVVEFDMFYGQEANCGGQCEGVDLVSVSDGEGRFFISSQKKFDWMNIRVEAPAFARKKFFRLGSGPEHELKLSEGAVVTGRILKNGEPVREVGVGLVSMDRSEHFTGNYDTFTDAEGRFSFVNVPPYQMYYVYTLMDKTPDGLVAPVQKVRVAADASRKDVGDIPLINGARVRGRVVLSDNKPVPPATQLYVGREAAWDGRSVLLDGEGRFDVATVPGESVTLGVRVKGYRFSEKNKSLDRLNGGSLIGRVDNDTEVTILLEPGEFERPDFSKIRLTPNMRPENEPLQGAGLLGPG